ncbi:MAG: Ig-like domain-containing protein [Catenibacterium sp.]|uniref:Ig-like domain-containing protein n=1 Tax=Catenibacterium sp. TaxID=2049022 RepID=UPI002F938563
MKEKKMTWQKILLIIFFWPFAIIYYGGKYLIKFYKSSKYTVKQKVIYTIIGVCVLSALGAISASSLNPEIEKVTISDITLYKGTTKKIKSKITPDKVVVKNIEYTSYDPNIISISGKGNIEAKNEGTTTVVCKVTDDNEKTVKSNKFKVIVELTEEQKEELRKKAEEKALKAEQELQQKRNSLSIDEAIRIKDECEQIVNQILKAPGSAKYPGAWYDPLNGWGMKKVNNLVTVSSYVDAQNSFSANLRTYFVMQFRMNDDGSGSLSYFKFGNQVVTGSYSN